MSETNEAYQAMDTLRSNITPFTHFPEAEMRDQVVMSALASEHLLFEARPGSGKTVTAKAIARSLDVGLGRHQGNPHATTRDVTGMRTFNQETGTFDFVPGPVFNPILFLDELNRNRTEVQASMVEPMEERQVTIYGETRPLDENFWVIATENPDDIADGINLVSENVKDRFGGSIDMSKPHGPDDAKAIHVIEKHWLATGGPEPVLDATKWSLAKQALRDIYLNADDDLARHAGWYVETVRSHAAVNRETSLLDHHRPVKHMLILGAAHCALRNSTTMGEVDVNAVAPLVLGHRTELKVAEQRRGTTKAEVFADMSRRLA